MTVTGHEKVFAGKYIKFGATINLLSFSQMLLYIITVSLIEASH